MTNKNIMEEVFKTRPIKTRAKRYYLEINGIRLRNEFGYVTVATKGMSANWKVVWYIFELYKKRFTKEDALYSQVCLIIEGLWDKEDGIRFVEVEKDAD